MKVGDTSELKKGEKRERESVSAVTELTEDFKATSKTRLRSLIACCFFPLLQGRLGSRSGYYSYVISLAECDATRRESYSSNHAFFFLPQPRRRCPFYPHPTFLIPQAYLRLLPCVSLQSYMPRCAWFYTTNLTRGGRSHSDRRSDAPPKRERTRSISSIKLEVPSITPKRTWPQSL